MGNRVSPIPPEKPDKVPQQTTATSKGFQKVEEVHETDADEQRSKKQKAGEFQEALNEAENRFKKAKEMSSAPSLFDVYKGDEKKLTGKSLLGSPKSGIAGSLNQKAIPSPDFSPPPNVSFTPPPLSSAPPEESTSPLPQSNTFWNDVDEPPDQPPPPQQFEENPRSVDRTPEKKKSDAKDESTADSGMPGKPDKGKASAKALREEGEVPGKVPHKKEDADSKQSQSKDPFAVHAEKKEGAHKEKQTQATPASLQGAHPSSLQQPKKIREAREKELAAVRASQQVQKHEGEKHKTKQIEVVDPSYPPLPKEVATAVQPAMQTASPHLSSEAMSLFYRMVGMIHVMAATPGVSRTEIVLNSPSFASSRFFGSTITIEKHASAPNALNIRLSGSNEAVKAFKENLDGLTKAFQQVDLPFRVQRIEAVYASEKTERPVFHRKDSGGEMGGEPGERGRR